MRKTPIRHTSARFRTQYCFQDTRSHTGSRGVQALCFRNGLVLRDPQDIPVYDDQNNGCQYPNDRICHRLMLPVSFSIAARSNAGGSLQRVFAAGSLSWMSPNSSAGYHYNNMRRFSCQRNRSASASSNISHDFPVLIASERFNFLQGSILKSKAGYTAAKAGARTRNGVPAVARNAQRSYRMPDIISNVYDKKRWQMNNRESHRMHTIAELSATMILALLIAVCSRSGIRRAAGCQVP